MALSLILLLLLVGGVNAVSETKPNRELYSTTGQQAYVDFFPNNGKCLVSSGFTSTRYAEQTCALAPANFVVGDVEYNSFNMDCGNNGEGTVYFTRDCGSSPVSAQFATPVCALAKSTTQSLRFYCAPVASTGAPTRMPTPPEDVLTKRPTTNKPTKRGSPTKKPTHAPTPKNTAVTNSPTQTPRVLDCIAVLGTSPQECGEKMERCAAVNAPMKWGARSCRQGRKNLQDGGCQCKNYCGYSCKESCQEDSDCEWRPQNKKGSRCVHWLYGVQNQKNCKLP